MSFTQALLLLMGIKDQKCTAYSENLHCRALLLYKGHSPENVVS